MSFFFNPLPLRRNTNENPQNWKILPQILNIIKYIQQPNHRFLLSVKSTETFGKFVEKKKKLNTEFGSPL